MAEYIERDEAIRKTLEACVKVVGHGISQIAAVDIVEIMESIPTADVVEVVRCKDCIFYFPPFCNRPKNKPCQTHAIMPNDFCSYGERREGNE